MSQFSYQPTAQPQESNGLAIAGFVCSLIGLLSGGILSPIGLILSLVALGKPTGKGFAVTGVILGLLGSCGMIIVLFLVLILGLGAIGLGAAALMLAEPEKLELTTDMVTIAIAAKIYEEEQGFLPADLGVLDLRSSTMLDPWGNPYEFHFIDEDPGFDIISLGEDGVKSVEDDIAFSRLDEAWEDMGNISVDAHGDEGEGTLTFNIGKKVITLHGDDESGRITIDTGKKVIHLSGDEAGGHIDVDSKPDHEPDHEGEEPDSHPATAPDDDAKHDPGSDPGGA